MLYIEEGNARISKVKRPGCEEAFPRVYDYQICFSFTPTRLGKLLRKKAYTKLYRGNGRRYVTSPLGHPVAASVVWGFAKLVREYESVLLKKREYRKTQKPGVNVPGTNGRMTLI